MPFTVLVTDRQLNYVGDPIDGWTDLDATLRFNEPGAATLTVKRSALTEAQLAPGNRLVVRRDPAPALGITGEVLIAGPIEKPGPQRWSIDGQDSGSGTIDLTFADDLASIAAERAHPDPLAALTAQAVARRTFTATNAEDVMRALVNENVGPGALVARRIPKLVLGTDAGVGTNVTMGFRMDPLGDALRSVAIAGGGLGFRTTQVGSQIQFLVYQPVDRTGQVRFSRGLGNLRSYTYDPEAPTATVAIIGDGSGEGTSRIFYEYTDATAVSQWGRYVEFVDRRDTTTPAELDQAGAEALARGAEKARLSTVTIDTATQRYGVHYGLGDRVSVELNSGAELADVVRAVHIQATPNAGEYVTALIGSQDASTDPAWVRTTRELARRLGRLEAR